MLRVAAVVVVAAALVSASAFGQSSAVHGVVPTGPAGVTGVVEPAGVADPSVGRALSRAATLMARPPGGFGIGSDRRPEHARRDDVGPRPDVRADRSERAAPRSVTQSEAQGTPWWAPLVSAAVPGGGQAVLGQDRSLAYLAVEAYGWLRYASDVREARRQRDGYRYLAARVARANLSDSRPAGDFEYYERMEQYVESGVFDASSMEGVQPEADPESYNGFIWLRARTTFWEDPTVPPPVGSDAYVAALAYYSGRAIKPEFRWSWRNAQLEQDVFRRTISRSNEAFRRSIQDLGVVIANHALSTVDAYVSLRLRRSGTSPRDVGIEASVPWSPRIRRR